ncbi:MAG TPA: CotH kinase family protein, partial [Rhodothermales bacterium]
MRGIDARSGVILVLCLLTAWPASAQSGDATIPEYHVTVDPDSFAFILQFPHEDIYVGATVTSGGITYTGVRMRIRGDSSRNRPKKSFKLEFTGRALPRGVRTLNLNADYLDESYLHTALSSILMRRSGQPVFDARHALLYVNGRFNGIYLQVENMDEAFLARMGLDPQGNLYKASLDGACLSPYDDVLYHWEKKTNENDAPHDLVELIVAINSVPQPDYEAFAREWFDYDAMVNLLAMNMLIANGSTYYHNYYMYHDVRGSGKWTYLPWDTDFSFGSYGITYDYRRSSGSGTPDNPYHERAIISESILADVRSRVEELAGDVFHPDVLNPIIDSIAAVIAPYVPLDSLDGVSDLQEWQSRVDAEKRFIELRPSYLLRQIDENVRSFLLDREPDITPEGITFRWSRSVSPQGDPVRYSLVLARTTTFNSLTDRVFRDLTDTTLTVSPLPAPGRYFWWVTAI